MQHPTYFHQGDHVRVADDEINGDYRNKLGEILDASSRRDANGLYQLCAVKFHDESIGIDLNSRGLLPGLHPRVQGSFPFAVDDED